MKLKNREDFKGIYTCPGFVRLTWKGSYYQFNLSGNTFFKDSKLSLNGWSPISVEEFEKLINPHDELAVTFNRNSIDTFVFVFYDENDTSCRTVDVESPGSLSSAYDPKINEYLNNKAALLDNLEQGKIQNEQGGKESNILMRYDLLPPLAITEISRVLKTGAETYGVDNWRKLSVATNINHALYHLVMYLVKPNLKDLSHAGCRILFAIELYIKEQENKTSTNQLDR